MAAELFQKFGPLGQASSVWLQALLADGTNLCGFIRLYCPMQGKPCFGEHFDDSNKQLIKILVNGQQQLVLLENFLSSQRDFKSEKSQGSKSFAQGPCPKKCLTKQATKIF